MAPVLRHIKCHVANVKFVFFWQYKTYFVLFPVTTFSSVGILNPVICYEAPVLVLRRQPVKSKQVRAQHF